MTAYALTIISLIQVFELGFAYLDCVCVFSFIFFFNSFHIQPQEMKKKK